MAMMKEQKAVVLDEITDRLKESPTLYLTNYSGLTVEQVNDLRTQLRNAGVGYKIYKNTFLRIAMDRVGGYEDLYEHLNGPTAVAYCDEPAAPARVFKKFLKDHKLEIPELKGAYIDGAIFHSDALDVLAELKSKDEIIGEIIGLLMAPISNIVGGLQAQGGNLVGILQTLAEREEAYFCPG